MANKDIRRIQDDLNDIKANLTNGKSAICTDSTGIGYGSHVHKIGGKIFFPANQASFDGTSNTFLDASFASVALGQSQAVKWTGSDSTATLTANRQTVTLAGTTRLDLKDTTAMIYGTNQILQNDASSAMNADFYQMSMYAKNQDSTSKEFARISASTLDTTAGSEDGALCLWGRYGSSITKRVEIKGDMNGGGNYENRLVIESAGAYPTTGILLKAIYPNAPYYGSSDKLCLMVIGTNIDSAGKITAAALTVSGAALLDDSTVRMNSLPVVDPHVQGRLYNNNGSLMVSAG